MFGALVSIDSRRGILNRYVVVGGPRKLTHSAEIEGGGPVSFTPEIVSEFFKTPNERFRVSKPSTPPTPPAGGTPVAMKAAA